MKTFKLLLALMLVALSARAQNPVSVRSTNGFATNLTANGTFAGNGSGLSGIDYNNLVNVRGSTNTTVLQMSIPSGNNGYNDMLTAVNEFRGQLGFAYQGTSGALWFSGPNAGTGTNAWGYPVSFLGDVESFGCRQWLDVPLSWDYGGGIKMQSAYYMAWGCGPTASSFSANYPNGRTNPAGQPNFYIINGNPFNGAGGIDIEGSFTNSARGVLQGTNIDGVKVYTPQFGLQILELGDAYTLDGTAQGAEAQQSPSYNFLMNDTQIDVYFSINGRRGGDNYLGQEPLMCFSDRTDHVWGIPLQVANVWAVTNINWKWVLKTDGDTGEVDIQHGALFISNSPTGRSLEGDSTNIGAFVFGGGYDTSAMCNINGNANFNAFANSDYGAWTFSSDSANHNFGILTKAGQFTGIAVANGREFHVYNSSASDLQTTLVQSQTLTDILKVDSSGNLTAPGSVTSQSGTSIFPSATVSGALAAGTISGNGSGVTNVAVANISGIKAGFTNVTAATSVAIVFTTPMPSTNYNVLLSGSGSTLAGMFDSAHTTNGFTANFTLFTGALEWSVILRTQ